jgi:hypothetical protein
MAERRYYDCEAGDDALIVVTEQLFIIVEIIYDIILYAPSINPVTMIV